MLDDRQFKKIYDEYSSLVYNVALNYMQHVEMAKDITQDVFVKIFKSFDAYNAASASMKTWIYRITINQCIDQQRRQRSKKRFGIVFSIFGGGQEESNQIEIPDFNHPGIQAEYKDELRRVFGFINELPSNQKAAIVLTRIEDRSLKEAAEIMNVTEKALDGLLYRAKQTLEKKLLTDKGMLK